MNGQGEKNMFEKKCKSTETNIYDSLWYLREDVSKISQERRRVGIIWSDISEIWRLVKMEKWYLRSLYIGSWSEWELSRPKALEKSSSVGFALHRWMCETARRLEQLIALCEPRKVSSKSEARELSTPCVWIEESCDLVIWKSKLCFFLLLRKGKIKVLRGYCGGGGPKFMHIGP